MSVGEGDNWILPEFLFGSVHPAFPYGKIHHGSRQIGRVYSRGHARRSKQTGANRAQQRANVSTSCGHEVYRRRRS